MPNGTVYRIRVKGRLDPSWSDRLGGVQITHDGPTGSQKSTLVGIVVDQAALSGILQTLFDHQFPVISVEHLGSDT